MQKKTKYCNSLVSKVLPTINEIGDNNLIFNQIDNSLCFAVYELNLSPSPNNSPNNINCRLNVRNAY